MAHDNIRLLISLDLDGMLTDRQRDDLRRHTRACANCAQAWDDMRRMDTLLRVQPEIAPLPDFRTSVMGRVKAYEIQRRLNPWLIALLGGLAAAVLVSTLLPVAIVAFEWYKPLLAWPIVGTMLVGIAHGFTAVVEVVRLAIHDLFAWLGYLTTDPAALSIVIGGLVVASTWIGLREVQRSALIAEVAQRA
jgi:anti-sigma factor RsiW